MKPSRRMTRLKTTGAALLLSALPFAAQACNAEPYIGTVCTFSFDWCPTGYMPADGRTLNIRDYTALFGLIGFSYGGDKQNTFGLPDLRGRTTIGKGQGTGLPINITMGQSVGQQQLTLSTAQTPLPAHTHTATFSATPSTTKVTIPGSSGNLAVTAALQVVQGTGNISGNNVTLGANQTGYLAGMNGATSADPVSFNGPYTTATPPANAGRLPAQVQITGNASTAAVDIQVPTISGGAVVVAQATAPAAAVVSTQSPAIGMSTCIAVTGLYPNRP
ncbi:phage tail protein [Duganella sp. CY15W]|uniref:phage tail protein n=1 Tax=Duganella sp. CY15W TaxID=2692172 RepID=UPI00136D1FB7|nr:tail fiber protein [Duganella sp. CY15W]MYM31603.1 phage tail protein [Duganella sp. CY15W]